MEFWRMTELSYILLVVPDTLFYEFVKTETFTNRVNFSIRKLKYIWFFKKIPKRYFLFLHLFLRSHSLQDEPLFTIKKGKKAPINL